jgi:hypothetical protein
MTGLPILVRMKPARRRPAGRSPKRSHSSMPLIVVSLLIGVFMARWLGQRTRQLARTDWTEAKELKGASLSELQLANGQSLMLSDASPHVVYLFQYDCAACDAQRAHVADLLEAAPAAQVVSVSAQPAALSPGYWGDLGSPLPQPVGADSAWLASHHFDHLPLLLFVGRNGRVSRAIRGSLLSWSEHSVMEALKDAGGV